MFSEPSRKSVCLVSQPCHLLRRESRERKWVSILLWHQKDRLFHCASRMSQSAGDFPLTQARDHSLNLEINHAQHPGGTVFVLHGSNSAHLARKDSRSTLTSSEKTNRCLFSSFLP